MVAYFSLKFSHFSNAAILRLDSVRLHYELTTYDQSIIDNARGVFLSCNVRFAALDGIEYPLTKEWTPFIPFQNTEDPMIRQFVFPVTPHPTPQVKIQYPNMSLLYPFDIAPDFLKAMDILCRLDITADTSIQPPLLPLSMDRDDGIFNIDTYIRSTISLGSPSQQKYRHPVDLSNLIPIYDRIINGEPQSIPHRPDADSRLPDTLGALRQFLTYGGNSGKWLFEPTVMEFYQGDRSNIIRTDIDVVMDFQEFPAFPPDGEAFVFMRLDVFFPISYAFNHNEPLQCFHSDGRTTYNVNDVAMYEIEHFKQQYGSSLPIDIPSRMSHAVVIGPDMIPRNYIVLAFRCLLLNGPLDSRADAPLNIWGPSDFMVC